MRIISIEVTSDELYPSSNLAGYENDNQTTQLQFRIPRVWTVKGYDIFLLLKPEYGNTQISEQLEPTDGVAVFELPAFILPSGELTVQLRAEDGERVAHSPYCRLWVMDSLEVDGEIPKIDGTLQAIQKRADEALERCEGAEQAFFDWLAAAQDQLEQNMLGRGSRAVLSEAEPDGMLTGDVWYSIVQTA